jgi:hypothetical protein
MSEARPGWWLRSFVLGPAIVVGLVVALGAGATDAAQTAEVPWLAHLRAVEAALVRMDLGAAERAWQDAYLAALGSWRWDGMLEVAGAYLRIGQAAGRQQSSAARARNLYLAALFRAREQRSLDGVLRTAEAFARLGDRDMVQQCLRMAETLASETRDPHAPARIRAFTIRLADPTFATRDAGR